MKRRRQRAQRLTHDVTKKQVFSRFYLARGNASQQRATAALAAGLFYDEIAPITVTMGVADKVRGLIVDEFDGQAPPPYVFDAVLAYLDSLDIAHCADPAATQKADYLDDYAAVMSASTILLNPTSSRVDQ